MSSRLSWQGLVAAAVVVVGASAPALVAQAADAPQAQAAASPPRLVANPTLRSVPLTLTARGKLQHYTVEVAATPLEQERGLMFRTTMPRRHGMIFDFVPAKQASFWMENTVLPLDLIFIAPDHRVLSIGADAKPYSRDTIDSGGVVSAVLELNAGEAARIGLRVGDRAGYKLGQYGVSKGSPTRITLPP